MVDTNIFTVFNIPPYYFFAGIGLVFAFAFYILSIGFRHKPVDRNALILFASFIGLLGGAIGFGYLTGLCKTLFTGEPFRSIGIVFYGGLTGFVITFLVLQKIINKSIDKTILNIFAASIPLFHSFARVGCFFAGCCYGKTADTFICVDYILKGTTEVISVIPVQLIEAALNMILFFILWRILKKHPEKNILPIYLFTYAVFRFILEFLRGDSIRGMFGILSFSQIYSLIIILALIIIKIRGIKKHENI